MNNIGIDIGKSKCAVCMMDQDGEVLEETSYTNTSRTAALLARYAVDKYGPSRAVCESTGNLWQKTFTAFEKAGISIILSNPFKTKAIAESSVKTDKVDARVLADLLRVGMIGKCHVSDAEGRAKKELLRSKIPLVASRSMWINRVRNLLDRQDVDPKAVKGCLWREAALCRLDAVHLEDRNDDRVLRQMIRGIRHLNGEIDTVMEHIREEAAVDGDARLLLSVTGINVYAAMLLSAEIDGISRFSSPKKLVAWAGMCPTIHQSGNTTYHGRMRKDSNRKVNWIMIQCANVAVRYDERMKQYYLRIRRRHGHNVAITHVANKMLTIIWAMLTTRTPYNDRKEDLYQRKLKALND